MALSLSPMAPKKPKPVTLQMEQQNVARPIALQPTPAAPTPAAPTPAAPTPPREVTPAAAPSPAAAAAAAATPLATTGMQVGPSAATVTPAATTSGAPAMAGGFSSGGGGGYTPTYGTTAQVVNAGPAWVAGLGGGTGTGGTNIPVTGPGTRGDADQDGIPDNQEEGYNPFAGWTPTLPPGWRASEVAAWSDATGGQVAPPAGAPDEPASNEELNAQIRSLMEDLVSGRGMDVNTAEEEKLIRELMQDRLGQGLVEQRAKMGRAGFGASGALAAMEGDVRRQAGQQATQETLALRRQAEQEAIKNALQAVGVDIDVRGEARKAAFDEEFLNALKASLGLDGGEGAAGGRPQGSPSNLGETSAPGQGNPTEDRQNPAAASQGGSDFMVGSRAAVPNNAAYSRTEAGYDVYVTPNGDEYFVPAGA